VSPPPEIVVPYMPRFEALEVGLAGLTQIMAGVDKLIYDKELR
jgi:hypothetical protein